MWKDVIGYEGIYQVSSEGKVRSVDRWVTYKDDKKVFYYGKELVFSDNNSGYKKVILSRNQKHDRRYVHRLVAEHFLENKENKPQVNHKDGNPSNNNISNLEWVTSAENIKHSFDILNRKGTMKGEFGKEHNRSKGYIQISMNNEEIKRWASSYEIERELGIQQQNISKVCKGLRNSAGGFKWKYDEDYEYEQKKDRV